MDYEDLIEDDPKPETETLEAEIEDEAAETKPRAKSPWKAFILTGFLAGLIGAAGGGFGAYSALKNVSPAPAVQANVDFSPLEAQLNRLTDRMNTAEAEVQSISNLPVVEIDPVDLTDLEDRLAVLENAPSPDIDADTLTALQAAQDDGFEWPDVSSLEERIAALEIKGETPLDANIPEDLIDRLSALEANVEQVQNTDSEATTESEMMVDVMSKLDARLSTLENRPPPKPVVERVSILAFPKAQLIAAVEANMDGGMIQKTLSRHIRVKDANDPLTLIDGIELDLSEGHLAAAAEKFERLPTPVRSAGQAWYESVKASL